MIPQYYGYVYPTTHILLPTSLFHAFSGSLGYITHLCVNVVLTAAIVFSNKPAVPGTHGIAHSPNAQSKQHTILWIQSTFTFDMSEVHGKTRACWFQ